MPEPAASRHRRAAAKPVGRPGTHRDDQGKEYLGRDAAARYLGVSRSTMDRYRRRHPTELAGYRIYGDQVLYKLDDLEKFRLRYLTPRPVEPEAVPA